MSACSTERHERIKWTPAWSDLTPIGSMRASNGVELEMRNCVCGSTLCKPVPRAWVVATDEVAEVPS